MKYALYSAVLFLIIFTLLIKKTEDPYRFGRNMLKERKSIMVQLLKANRKKCSRWWTYDWMKLFVIF
jgi:hypothetical protein